LEEALLDVEAKKCKVQGSTQSFHDVWNPFLKLFDFCEGCPEIYYLQKHLEAKPDLAGTVVAELPEEVFMESSNRPSSTISSSTKCKRDKESEIVYAICELQTSWMEAELNKKKMALMQQQEECWAAEQFFQQQEHIFKQQEETRKRLSTSSSSKKKPCKAAEHIFKQQEDACKE
jgi:hypothetical protein